EKLHAVQVRGDVDTGDVESKTASRDDTDALVLAKLDGARRIEFDPATVLHRVIEMDLERGQLAQSGFDHFARQSRLKIGQGIFGFGVFRVHDIPTCNLCARHVLRQYKLKLTVA